MAYYGVSIQKPTVPAMRYIVRVENKHGNFWLGQRVYSSYDAVLTVKHNLQDTGRYTRVYVVPATDGQVSTALSIQE